MFILQVHDEHPQGERNVATDRSTTEVALPVLPDRSDKVGIFSPAAFTALVATAVVATVSAVDLGRQGYWWDEVFSVAFAQLAWNDFFGLLTSHEANMSLYFTLLKLWSYAGSGEAFTRLLSLIFGVASVPMIFVLGKRLLGPNEGAVAAVLLSVNAFLVARSQEARGYSLLVLLAITSAYLFVRLIEDPRFATALTYAVVAGLAMYAHFFAALAIAIQFAFAVALKPPRGGRRYVTGAYGAIAVMGLPLLAFTLFRGTSQVDWITRPDFLDVGRVFISLSGGRPILFLYLVLSVPCLLRLKRALDSGSSEAWKLMYLVAWLLGPIVIAFVISRLSTPVFVDRYLVVSLPALALVAASGVTAMRPRAMAFLTLAVLVGLCVRQLYLVHAAEGVEDWRGSSGYVLENWRPGDTLAFYESMARIPFGYYAGKSNQRAQLRHLSIAFDPDARPAEDSVPALACGEVCEPRGDWGRPELRPARRIWLVLAHNLQDSSERALTRRIQVSFANGRTLEERRQFGNVTVERYG